MVKDFSVIREGLFNGELKEMELERVKYVKKFWVTFNLVLFGIIALIVLAMFFLKDTSFATICYILAGLLFLVGVILMVIKYNQIYKKMHTYFKQTIVPLITEKIDNRISYFPTQGLLNEYSASGMFVRGYDRAKAEDTFRGQFDLTTFAFGEVFTEYKTVSTDSKGRRKESWHTIFRGIFFTSDFHKNFSGETYVDVDTMERMFGKFGRKFQKMNASRSGELIKMENPEFEKYFAVYSSNEQESRYILTPSIMERMVNIKEKLNTNVAFSFRNNHLYIAVSKYENLFEPTVFRSLLNEQEYRIWWELISSMSQIVEDLNLNTRIWTRE